MSKHFVGSSFCCIIEHYTNKKDLRLANEFKKSLEDDKLHFKLNLKL